MSVDADAIRSFYDALHAGDFEALGERLHDDVAFEFPGRRFGGRFDGKRRVLVFFKQNQRLFRDGLKFDVAWVGVDGERAVAQWTNAGTARDGRPYANRGVTIFRADRSGKIVEILDYLDTETLSETWPPK